MNLSSPPHSNRDEWEMGISLGQGPQFVTLGIRRRAPSPGSKTAFDPERSIGIAIDVKATFSWLDRAWSERDPGIQGLLTDPFIQRYKDDPRFAVFCKRVGLPTPAEVRKRT
jgi:hypothetical protein